MRPSWIPRRGHLMVAQNSIPSGWRVKNSRGPAVTVDEGEELGFITGDLISSISTTVTALAPKAKAMYSRYKTRRRKKRSKPLAPIPAIVPQDSEGVPPTCPPGFKPVQVSGWDDTSLGALGQAGFA